MATARKALASVKPGAKPTLRDRILAAQDIKIEAIDVPEWADALDGEQLYVKALTGHARDAIERMTTDNNFRFKKELFDNFRALYCTFAIVDADGRQVFEMGDVEALGDKSSIALQRVYDKAVALSAVRASDVDGIAEDLKEDPSVVSGSD